MLFCIGTYSGRVLIRRRSYGTAKKFSVKTVWGSIRPRSNKVWYEMKGFAGLPNSSSSIDAILNDIYPFAMKKTSRSVIAKLVLAAFTYIIWQERNNRIFKKTKRSLNQVIECIMNSVHLKLMSCRWKKTRDA
ncbi:hypothetical protein Tco_0404442 [Tanacetum coccineum]